MALPATGDKRQATATSIETKSSGRFGLNQATTYTTQSHMVRITFAQLCRIQTVVRRFVAFRHFCGPPAARMPCSLDFICIGIRSARRISRTAGVLCLAVVRGASGQEKILSAGYLRFRSDMGGALSIGKSTHIAPYTSGIKKSNDAWYKHYALAIFYCPGGPTDDEKALLECRDLRELEPTNEEDKPLLVHAMNQLSVEWFRWVQGWVCWKDSPSHLMSRRDLNDDLRGFRSGVCFCCSSLRG